MAGEGGIMAPGNALKGRGSGVSEVIGTLVLIGVVMIGIALIGLFLFSAPSPTKVPVLDTIISNRSTNIYILHKGGDPLRAGEYRILVDGGDQTGNFSIMSPGTEPWSVGETLTGISPAIPRRVLIVFNQTGGGGGGGEGGGGSVLAVQDLIGSAAVPQAQTQSNWYFNAEKGACNWKYRKQIAIDHTKVVGADQTNFPVLISLASDNDLKIHARSDGTDILFTGSDGASTAPYEIENYTSSSGTLTAWVKITALSSSTETLLYLYYGNGSSTTSQANPIGVWNTNYMAVWHHDRDFLDSTSNSNTGTNGESTTVGGMMALARDYNGATSYVQMLDSLSLTNIFASGGTFSAWIKPRTIGENSEGFIGSKASSELAKNGWTFATSTNNVLMFRKGFSNQESKGGYWSTPLNSLTMNAWQYVVVTYNSGSPSNVPAIYINGISQTITTNQAPDSGSSAASDAGNRMRIGNYAYNDGRTFDGAIDEIRVSNSIRDANWIAAEYNNQYSPSSFTIIGAEETYWMC